MSENVATLEPAAPAAPAPTQEQKGNTDINQLMAENLWNLNPTEYRPVDATPAPTEQAAPAPPAPTEQAAPAQSNEAAQAAAAAAATPADDEVVGLDDYFNREYGMSAVDFKKKWDEVSTQAQQPQEVKWTYDESKEDEIYNYIHQKKQLDRLEKMEVADAHQAAEIIRANLQFKYKDLTPAEIDRLFTRQYSMPAKPTQAPEQLDDDYAVAVEAWKAQVKEKEQDMIIDAKLARPELAKVKNEIVKPDIPKIDLNQQQIPDQKALEAHEAGRKSYLSALENEYHNFKGFSVTAKNGDVQLPVTYSISPEELVASKKMIENFNVEGFIDSRWFDKGVPKINQIQEDLYLLLNRDKIFQAIANESASKMDEHKLKIQNNINLNGVNNTLGPNPPANPAAPKNTNQMLADKIWAM